MYPSTTHPRMQTLDPRVQMLSTQAKKVPKRKYDALTNIEMVLLRTETFAGQKTSEKWGIVAAGEVCHIDVIPALYKIFDEAVTNSADCFQRGDGTTAIRIEVEQTRGIIRVWNDGKSVPVKKHDKKDPLTGKKIFLPELVFFRLFAGSNYDDDVERTSGGRNGVGIKLGSIFSHTSTVECCDSKGRCFKQTYTNNMRNAGKVYIEECTPKDPWTQVTFELDLARFSIDGTPLTRIPDGVFQLMQRRAFDLAACCEGVKVTFNGAQLTVDTFESYSRQQLGTDPLFISSKKNWSVAVSLTDRDADENKNVSFVNNVWTREDGEHVRHVKEEISKVLLESQVVKRLGLAKKDIEKQLRLVVKCYLINPTFNSQGKEKLTLPIKSFSSKFVITGPLKKKLLHGPLIERLKTIKEEKDGRKMKKNDGKKVRYMSILYLEDARFAGGQHSKNCSLVLTEGNSALALALAGSSEVDRRLFGYYPLRGKILNGYKSTPKQWAENKIIQNVIKILGLKHGVKYTSTKDLRYGSIIIMADQDIDGFHIRGLVMSIFGSHWKELLAIPGFIKVMKTPLVKFFRGKTMVKEFFDEASAIEYGKTHPNLHRKYYKGLGSSTSAEGKEYFRHLDRYVFPVTGNFALLERAFGSDTAFRKQLSALPPQINDGVTCDDFVHGPFSMYVRADNDRKIADGSDGLKTVQRKILWTLMMKKFPKDIKVAQLAGIAANFTHYHSGEENISKAIINMAQNYPGSNNLPFCTRGGQFGTRKSGGKDAAAPRYITTALEKWVSLAYPPDDNPVYERAIVDGYEVEPGVFIPIICMVLVNGVTGIGTGQSCFIPQHNPHDLIKITRARLQGVTRPSPTPWTSGHHGMYYRTDTGQLKNRVHVDVVGTTVKFNELPVGVWTDTVEEELKKAKPKFEFDSFEQTTTDVAVSFTIRGVKNVEKLVAALHLDVNVNEKYTTIQDGVIVESEVQQIMDFHFHKRKELYVKRKAYQCEQLVAETHELQSKCKFIEAYLAGYIPIRSSDEHIQAACKTHGVDEKYMDLKIRSLTRRKVNELRALIVEKQRAYNALKARSIEDIWLHELNELERHLVPNKKKRDIVDLTE